MKELKNLIISYYQAKEKGDLIEKKWMMDPENETLENEFDMQYEIEFELHSKLQEKLIQFTNNKLGLNEVNFIINEKKESLLKMVTRM